jgi:hypothetical protein
MYGDLRALHMKRMSLCEQCLPFKGVFFAKFSYVDFLQLCKLGQEGKGHDFEVLLRIRPARYTATLS